MYKVIIVDDEVLIRKRIRLGFDWEAMGYQVQADAGSGQEALELLREGEYDLAVVDIAMPGMNGIELVKRLREEKNDLQVIFLTGHSEFAYARQAITYGVYSYILKPVDEEEFIETLKKLKEKLDEEALLSEFLIRKSLRENPPSSANKHFPIVRKACTYMKENYSNAELTQSGIAEAMGVTPAYLSGVFKKAMGLSMSQYLSTIRLEQAKGLLEEQDREVREVALLVGYSDEYYFSRCFKKYHGCSPSQMKRARI